MSLVGKLLATAVLPAALLTACGDDGGPAKTAEAAPSATAQPDWALKVNALCAANARDVQAVGAQVAKSGVTDTRAALARVLDKSRPLERQLLSKLRAVDVPPDVQTDYAGFVDRIADEAPLFGDLSAVLRSGKEDPALTAKLKAIAADTKPFAAKYALAACLSSSAQPAG
jgi:hypothetical protein